jgi:FMN phosphatase YigB (HAD superfamily)
VINIFLPQIEYIYFDFDNVLAKRSCNRSEVLAQTLQLDSAENVRKFYLETFKNNPFLLKQYQAIHTEQDEIDFYNVLFTQYTIRHGGLDNSQLVLSAARNFVETPFETINGAEVYVKNITKKGYRIGILTNGLPSRHREIESSGLKKYFSTILVSSDYGVEKPQSRIYEIAITNASVVAQKIAFIDDEVLNVEAALESGFGQAIQFTPAFWQQAQ